MGKLQNLTGQIRGRFTVVGRAGNSPAGRTLWLCRCECGNEKTVAANHLNTGHIKSCGCLSDELRIARNKAKDNHGMIGSPEYLAYYAARRRCSPKNKEKRAAYYDRGIRVTFSSFKQFYNEVGCRPNGHSLDRIDNDRGYEPGNVRWASAEQQIRNQRCDNCTVLKARIKELEAENLSLRSA